MNPGYLIAMPSLIDVRNQVAIDLEFFLVSIGDSLEGVCWCSALSYCIIGRDYRFESVSGVFGVNQR